MLVAGLATFFAIWPATSAATHAPPGTKLWGYPASSNSPIIQYDIGTDTVDSSCIPATSGNGRGIAYDPLDGNLWYTFVTVGTFVGDGLIHKTSPPPTCTDMGSIPFGDGPGGSVQDDIGALDIDPDDGNIWAAGYANSGGIGSNTNNKLYKVDRATGAIMADCQIPPNTGGAGNDTLAVAKLSGLPGSGTYLLTDDGEVSTTTLYVYDRAACTGNAFITPVTTYTLPFGVSGIDLEGGPLIASTLATIESLDGPPFASSVASMPGNIIEDLTLQTQPVAAGADLSITKSGAPNPVVSGNRLTYTLSVTNNGPQDATGVTVTDPLPGNVHFNSVASTQGTCIRSATTKPLPKNGTITCSLGNLAHGASASITIVVTTTTPRTLTNTATVVGNETDPNPLNNSSTATTTVTGT
jgi:uncharacterized repeat protein (TIGR01451 family)